MSKVAWILAATTLGLSVACAHLYRELQAERSRSNLVAAAGRDPASMDPTTGDMERLEVTDPSDGFELSTEGRPFDSPRRGAQASPPSSESQPQDRARQIAERQAELQRRWADPQWRELALPRAAAQVRQERPDLGSALHLSADQEAALVDLLARQRLQRQELNEQMRFASPAERGAIQQKLNALQTEQYQEVAQSLGPGQFSEYEAYLREVPERWEVRELRSRLDESAVLTGSQSSRLIDAMYQERESYLQQMQSIEGYGGHSTQYPIGAIPKDRDPVARVQFAEAQLERTEQFMDRLRLRAQQILSAEQLRRFDEIQKEQFAGEQARVERMRNQAERRAMRRPPQ
jgi:hypothetical protein